MNWREILNDILLVMTQQELADEIGVSQTTVSFLATGVRCNPSYNAGLKILETHALKISQINAAKQKSPN